MKDNSIMDLSYEITMMRIEEYEKDDKVTGIHHQYCKELQFPYVLDIYRGENQFIVSPRITTIGWYSTNMAWHLILEDSVDAETIGSAVNKAFDHIKTRWVDARTLAERKEDDFIKKSTKCKSYKSFNKKYSLCGINLNSDQTIIVSPTYRLDNNKGYGGYGNKDLIYMNPTSDPVKIGDAVLKCFSFMDKNELPNEVKRVNTIELMSDNKIKYDIPDEERYTEEDFHSAEIYHGYSYLPDKNCESVAQMYFSSASELDNVINEEKVVKDFTVKFGKPKKIEYRTTTGVFYNCYADITGNGTRKIVFIKKIDEDELFASELIIDVNKLSLAEMRRIVDDFISMSQSCELF